MKFYELKIPRYPAVSLGWVLTIGVYTLPPVDEAVSVFMRASVSARVPLELIYRAAKERL